MLLKIAWRNIWRNTSRSIIVIIAISLGLWAGVFVSAFVNGIMKQKIESIISLEYSDFQIHKKGFRDDYAINQYINNVSEINHELEKDPNIKSFTSRTINIGMLGSAQKTGGVKINGISAEEENKVTQLDKHISDGKLFDITQNNAIVISQEIANEYKVNLKSKLVLTFQDINGELVGTAYKVIGIYNTGNKMYDGHNVFVNRNEMQKSLGIGEGVHEIAVLLNDHKFADAQAIKYNKLFPYYEVLSWMDLASGMRYITGFIDKYTMIIVGIILTALLLSILNTMLMAVLERVKELGILMAIGMTRKKVFSMIMLETIFLSLIGGPIGLFLAWISIMYFGNNGINLGKAAYSEWGFSNIIFPSLYYTEYVKVSIMVLVMSILAALYPAYKAIKLNPVESIHHI